MIRDDSAFVVAYSSLNLIYNSCQNAARVVIHYDATLRHAKKVEYIQAKSGMQADDCTRRKKKRQEWNNKM